MKYNSYTLLHLVLNIKDDVMRKNSTLAKLGNLRLKNYHICRLVG